MANYRGWFEESPHAHQYPLVCLQGRAPECHVELCGKISIPVFLGKEPVVLSEKDLDDIHDIMVKSRVWIFGTSEILYRMSCFVYGKRVVVYVGFPQNKFCLYHPRRKVFRPVTENWAKEFNFERIVR